MKIKGAFKAVIKKLSVIQDLINVIFLLLLLLLLYCALTFMKQHENMLKF